MQHHHRASSRKILKHQQLHHPTPPSTTSSKTTTLKQHQRQLCVSCCDYSLTLPHSSCSSAPASASSFPCSSLISSSPSPFSSRLISPSPPSPSASSAYCCCSLQVQSTKVTSSVNCPCSCSCNLSKLIMRTNSVTSQGDSVKLTCSVYPSVWSVLESTLRKEVTTLIGNRIMKKRRKNSGGEGKMFTLWSTLPLLLLPLLLLPMVNAYSTSSLSTLAVNPSSSMAFKSSPGVPSTILASGGTSSSSSSLSSFSSSSSSSVAAGGRNAFTSHRTNQYQETQPHAMSSSLTGANFAHGYNNNFQSNSHFTNSITPNQFDWLTREAIGEVKKVFYSRIQKYNGKFQPGPL